MNFTLQDIGQILTGTSGLLIFAFILITAVLYFFIPWMIRAINNKVTKIVELLESIKFLLKEINQDKEIR